MPQRLTLTLSFGPAVRSPYYYGSCSSCEAFGFALWRWEVVLGQLHSEWLWPWAGQV